MRRSRCAVARGLSKSRGATGSSLELLERHAHAGVEQPLERSLDPVLPYQSLDVAELDPGVVEQPPVRARRARVHAAVEELEEAPLPVGEGGADPLPRLGARHRRAEEPRQVDGVAGGEPKLPAGVHDAGSRGRNLGSVTSSVTSSKTTSTGRSQLTSPVGIPTIAVGSRGPSSSSTTAAT